MSQFRRRIMSQSEGQPSGLVTVGEFEREINSIDGRAHFPVGLQARLQSGKKYHISFDIKITSIAGNPNNFTQVVSSFPRDFFDVVSWGYCGRGIYAGFEKLYHFEKNVTCKRSDPDGVESDIFQYDSSGAHAIFKAFNFTVEEVV